jgi:hypothetical protein
MTTHPALGDNYPTSRDVITSYAVVNKNGKKKMVRAHRPPTIGSDADTLTCPSASGSAVEYMEVGFSDIPEASEWRALNNADVDADRQGGGMMMTMPLGDSQSSLRRMLHPDDGVMAMMMTQGNSDDVRRAATRGDARMVSSPINHRDVRMAMTHTHSDDAILAMTQSEATRMRHHDELILIPGAIPNDYVDVDLTTSPSISAQFFSKEEEILGCHVAGELEGSARRNHERGDGRGGLAKGGGGGGGGGQRGGDGGGGGLLQPVVRILDTPRYMTESSSSTAGSDDAYSVLNYRHQLRRASSGLQHQRRPQAYSHVIVHGNDVTGGGLRVNGGEYDDVTSAGRSALQRSNSFHSHSDYSDPLRHKIDDVTEGMYGDGIYDVSRLTSPARARCIDNDYDHAEILHHQSVERSVSAGAPQRSASIRLTSSTGPASLGMTSRSMPNTPSQRIRTLSYRPYSYTVPHSLTLRDALQSGSLSMTRNESRV